MNFETQNQRGKLHLRIFYIGLILFLSTNYGIAQKKYTLELINTSIEHKIFNKINYKTSYSDSLSAFKELDNIVLALHQKAYLTASYDSVNVNINTIRAYLSIGTEFLWATLNKGNLSNEIIKKVDFKERIFNHKTFNYKQLSKLENKIIEHAENNGYPFASISLNNIKTTLNSIEGTLYFVPGKKILFDSIGIIGDAQISKSFLANYLQIKKGKPFDQQKIDNITFTLQKLNISVTKREPEIRFINGKAYIYLFLNKKRTTGIDGIAGLQQDPKDKEQLLFTGEFNLNLRNILSSGKRAELHWKKLDKESSSLISSYNQPALFGSPIELALSFNFLDQDSTYISLNPKFGFKYNLNKAGTIGFFYELVSTKLLDTSMFTDATTLPPFSDSKLNSYGINYEWNNLDNYFLPHKGVKIEMETSAGNKTINQVLSPHLYDGVSLNTLQLQAKAKIENHTFLFKNVTLVQRITGAWIENEKLFLNDLFRLGGINSLRGFREQSYFASKYLSETAELRVFTDETSYFMVFVDYAQFVTEIEGAWERNQPIGFGGGLSFTTKAGIFNMVYAIGKENGQQFNFNNSVVNFGLVSRF